MIYQDLNVPISAAGLSTMIVSGGTIISSFFSEKLIRKFGTGKVTTVSVFLTASLLLGNRCDSRSLYHVHGPLKRKWMENGICHYWQSWR